MCQCCPVSQRATRRTLHEQGYSYSTRQEAQERASWLLWAVTHADSSRVSLQDTLARSHLPCTVPFPQILADPCRSDCGYRCAGGETPTASPLALPALRHRRVPVADHTSPCSRPTAITLEPRSPGPAATAAIPPALDLIDNRLHTVSSLALPTNVTVYEARILPNKRVQIWEYKQRAR